jgi:hypothetical protein
MLATKRKLQEMVEHIVSDKNHVRALEMRKIRTERQDITAQMFMVHNA